MGRGHFSYRGIRKSIPEAIKVKSSPVERRRALEDGGGFIGTGEVYLRTEISVHKA